MMGIAPVILIAVVLRNLSVLVRTSERILRREKLVPAAYM